MRSNLRAQDGTLHSVDVAALQRPTSYPAVSLLLPIDAEPIAQVRARLRHLATEAVDRLRNELGADVVADYASRLSAAVDSVEITDGQRSVALFVGDQTTIVPLSVHVRERVVIDETYATRDLVRAVQRSPRYRVASFGPRHTRIYEGSGLSLIEVHGGGFPLSGPVSNGPTAGATRGRVARGDHRDGGRPTLERFIRAFDDGYDALNRNCALPLVLVGPESRLGAVGRQSRHRDSIVGTARGARDFPDRTALGRLLWPAIETMLNEETVDAIRELERSGGGPRYASGIEATWEAANHGRCDLLLVEEGFEYAARVDPTTGEAATALDRDAPGVVDDLVDEIIEVVIAKRGRCVIVPDGSLTKHDRIAMKLRY